jgi:hypothetical protein
MRWISLMPQVRVVVVVGLGTTVAGQVMPGEEQDAGTYNLKIIMEGAIAFVPLGAGPLESYDRVWALLPRSDDPGRRAFPDTPGFEPAQHLPLHHPVLRIPARNMVGAGDSSAPVWLRLGCRQPEATADKCQPAAGYDISIEPFAPSGTAHEAVVFRNLESIPTVYKTPPDASGRAGTPSEVAPELLKESPGQWAGLSARMVFQDSELLLVDTLPATLAGFASNDGCVDKPGGHCRASVTGLPSEKNVPAAVGVVATRPSLTGDLLLTLRDLEGNSRHRYLLTSRGEADLSIHLSNLTAEDLLGLPSEGLHVHSQDSMELIDHFVLFYLLAKPPAHGESPRLWFPAVRLADQGGVGKPSSRIDKHGKPWCSTPGIFR